ncbi:MAG: hypothetical protein QOH06_6274 [Acidobacteriota bacterium]|jgi:tetratricopeptide (TPR) repeat protein|nr:hypothetical protein [Acidobacteriota bacterium]
MSEPLFRPEDVPGPAWFGRYNFQREGDLVRLTAALTGGSSVVLLSGETGIGRRYLLQAAVRRLRQAGQEVEEILEIDLEGYDEAVGFAKYFELQVEKRRQEQGEARKELLEALFSAVRLGVKGTGWASLLSLTLSLKEPVTALRKIFGRSDKGFSGELFSAREILASILESLSGRVILHVVDPARFHAMPSAENPRRWLPEVAERFPHVVLVVSCGPGDQAAYLVPGALTDVERFELRRLDQRDLWEILDLRLAPNAFPPDLAETLERYSSGLPALVGRAVWKLEHEGALAEDGHWVWRVDDAKAAKLLEEKLIDPLSQAFHEHPEHVRALWGFLLDAALCGELVPANLLLDVQALAEEVEDDLADSIDEILVERFGVFEDLEYSHPGFPASVNVYRFREPIVRLAVLEHFQAKERRTRAAQIAPALRRGLLVTTRDVARLFVTLADHLGEDERDEFLRDLAWWVGMEEADDLRDGLETALAEGWLKPETLWGAIEGTKGRWPAYRRLALLDAYGTGPRDEEGNPLGVPMERLGEFHFLRAQLLLDLGRYQEAVGHAELAVRLDEAQSGRQSVPFLTASVLVGDLWWRLGDFPRAQNILQQGLDLAEKFLGPERHETLLAKHGLARVLQAQGELSRSREMCEEVLVANIRLLGPEHRDTLASKHTLAWVLQAQGELSRSREMCEEVLVAEIRLLGPEHPHTLTSKHSLAWVLQAQGELSRSREMYEEVLAAWIRLLGPEHTYTLTSKHRLAWVLQAQGELSRSREMYEEVLEARIRILGPEHFQTKETREALRKLDERSTSNSGEATAEQGFEFGEDPSS